MKFIKVEKHRMDYSIRLLGASLFIWRRHAAGRMGWGLGKRAGDGSFAILTPWFLLYPFSRQ